MKVHILRCNNVNKFTDKNDSLVKKYNPNIEGIKFHYYNKANKKMDIITEDDIHLQFGGSIYFIRDNEKFIIDDGYRDILCACGYLIVNNYDKERIIDRDLGISIRSTINKDILGVFDPSNIIYSSSSRITIRGESQCYNYTINFSTTTDIVHRNEERKENSLPVYPFDKNMDKYGTYYITIFGEKKINAIDTKYIKENDINAITQMILKNLNGGTGKISDYVYSYKPLVIKRRIINWEGL